MDGFVIFLLSLLLNVSWRYSTWVTELFFKKSKLRTKFTLYFMFQEEGVKNFKQPSQ